MSLSLAPIFASSMVLQRELPVRVWGGAEPGTCVDVRIQGQVVSCTADERGNWRCELAPLAASDAETLEVAAGDSRITGGGYGVPLPCSILGKTRGSWHDGVEHQTRPLFQAHQAESAARQSHSRCDAGHIVIEEHP